MYAYTHTRSMSFDACFLALADRCMHDERQADQAHNNEASQPEPDVMLAL